MLLFLMDISICYINERLYKYSQSTRLLLNKGDTYEKVKNNITYKRCYTL